MQIRQHNVRHTNIIAMKEVIILQKAKEEEMLSGSIADTTVLAEMAQVSSFVDLTERYNWVMSNANLDVVKELELTGIKKYWRRAGQVEIELDWLYDWISALATFVKHSRRVYDNKKIGQNISIRQDIDPKWVSSFFVQLHKSIQYSKMDGKNILDATKLVKEYVRYLFKWSTSGQPQQDHIWIKRGKA